MNSNENNSNNRIILRTIIDATRNKHIDKKHNSDRENNDNHHNTTTYNNNHHNRRHHHDHHNHGYVKPGVKINHCFLIRGSPNGEDLLLKWYDPSDSTRGFIYI